MVWCVAAPFFIGSISRGRTVRQTILGGYVFGVGSTLTSFIVLGNYSMGLQMTDKADFIAKYLENGDMYGMIVDMIKTMPGAPVVMVAVLITMIRNPLGAFRHKQDSTLVAEQTAISSIFAFFVSIYSVFVERPG